MNKKRLFIIIPISIFVLVFVLYKAFYHPQAPKSTAASEKISPSPGLSDENNRLPEIFPEDFPIYPDSQITSSWSAQNDLSQGFSVVWETPDSAKQVYDYYVNFLTLNNWEIEKTDNTESMIISFHKDKMSGFIGITSGDRNKTVVSVTMGIEK